MHPLRYIVVVNYESLLNNERKATVLGFYPEIEKAQYAIYEDIDNRCVQAKKYGERWHKGYNSLYIGTGDERFTYDIHDLCAEGWSCESRA